MAVTLLLAAPLQTMAQTGAGGPDDGGTIDIQANEQDFADDHVVARGNVHVIYKDSIIDAPMATLYKDPAGKPQKAIFTGHPHLKQGTNIIHADKLVFEMLTSIIIADGNAHSEVIPEDGSSATKTAKKVEAKGSAKKPAAKPQKTEEVTEDRPAAEVTADASSGSEDQTKEDATATKEPPAKASETVVKRDKIITDSDHQVFNRETGQFDANGNCRVKTGDIYVKSDTVKLVYDADKKPENALFTGNVKALQGSNRTDSDVMTYFLTTKRLQATGHVKSTVVQAKQTETPKKGGPLTTASSSISAQKSAKSAPSQKPPLAQAKASVDSEPVLIDEDSVDAQIAKSDAAAKKAQSGGGGESTDEKPPIFIFSDAQDYSENTGRCTADGSVKMFYQDTIGVAPKMIMIKNLETGETEKILLLGRCQVTQPGKRWIADRITYTISNDKVEAEGNTKAFILKQKTEEGGTKLAEKKSTTGRNTQILPTKKETIANTHPTTATGNTRLSATKVETPK